MLLAPFASLKSLSGLCLMLLACTACRVERFPRKSESEGTQAPLAPAPTRSAPAPAPLPIVPPPSGDRTEDEKNTITVFRSAAPSAVFVSQQQLVVDYAAGQAMEVPAGSGSGFVWDDKGHVVTNFHVVQDAKRLTVTLQDQRAFPARLVGVEPRKDVAVLHIEAPADALRPIHRSDKSPVLEVGQKVIAIGNPFGLDHTLTTGVVSALGREVQGIGGVGIRDMIQTDAAINPGNSGGPLLDSGGKLIGMNTMIFSRSGAWAGIGFAVPASTILRVVPQIIKTGRAEQVGLGVQIDPLQRLERRLGIRGVIVLSTISGTPADRAGMRGITRGPAGVRLGDVIVGIDQAPVHDYDDLYNALDARKEGDTAKVRVARDEKTLELPVELMLVK
ncbi:MAG TPA: trypsin-like peptidase domain-containing protein [Polyangiaceae bacterium]|nr:trypsin-like peptidase domain-containing protein [Polyangiaceae bacterium]